MVFLWSWQWCFCGSRDWGLPSSARRRHCFFSGRKPASREEKRENAIRGRDAEMDKQKGPRRVVGDFMRECRSRGGCATDSSRPDAPARAAGRPCLPPAPRAPRRTTDAADRAERERRTEPGVRQSSDAPAAWRRWQHGSDDGAADSTSITGYCKYTDDGPSSSSTRVQDERRRQRVERRSCKLLTCVSRNTGSARQRTGRWARRASRAGWRGSRADGV